jgi:hypothetical protein
MFVIDVISTNNLQITKTPIVKKLWKPKTSMFIRLSMLVGISEAIRLLSTHSYKFKNSNCLKYKNDKNFNE